MPGQQNSPKWDNRAAIVKRWDTIVRDAGDADLVTSKLVYEMLIQIRQVKLILAWVLVALPAIAIAVIIVLNVLADEQAS